MISIILYLERTKGKHKNYRIHERIQSRFPMRTHLSCTTLKKYLLDYDHSIGGWIAEMLSVPPCRGLLIDWRHAIDTILLDMCNVLCFALNCYCGLDYFFSLDEITRCHSVCIHTRLGRWATSINNP